MNLRVMVISMLCLCLVCVKLGQASAAEETASAIKTETVAGSAANTASVTDRSTVTVTEASNGNQIYETYLADTNVALTGVVTAKQHYFQIPSYWQAHEVKVNLDFKASPLLQEQSSVTLVINGTIIHSFRPPLGNEAKQRMTISVPSELIIKGTNMLSIEGSLPAATNQDLVCPPPQVRENWLQLYNTSSVIVQYTKTALKGSISDFNQRFIGLDTMYQGQNAIAISEKSTPAELEAAVYALSGFSKASSPKDKTIPLLTYSADNLKDKKVVVTVALYDHLPPEFRSLLSNQDLNNNALIQLINMDKQPTLVVTSMNPELLVKAGRLIANQALLGQLNSDIKVVNDLTEIASPVVNTGKIVTLTEAGDKLSGSMHREKMYFVSLPANRSIAEASKISLDFRYAKNLDFDRSMVTVFINETPIGSKKLTSVLADGDNIALPIPQNLGISGNFSVTVAFDLELKNNAGCIQNQEMPWAFITKDSIIQLNTKDRTELLFNNYPYPFLRDGIYNKVAVVLPEERDSYTYQTISNLFNLLGQYAEGNMGEVRFYGSEVAAESLQNRQIIAIGTYLNNKIIRENNSKLYFQYDLSGGGIRSNEKMSVDIDYGKRIGSLQLIDSPYGVGHGLLAVTGVGSEYYYLASKLVASYTTMWKIFGDGAVTDKDGNIQTYRFKKLADPQQESVISEVLQRKDVLGFMIAIVLVMVLILVSLLLLFRKYRLKRRGRQ